MTQQNVNPFDSLHSCHTSSRSFFPLLVPIVTRFTARQWQGDKHRIWKLRMDAGDVVDAGDAWWNPSSNAHIFLFRCIVVVVLIVRQRTTDDNGEYRRKGKDEKRKEKITRHTVCRRYLRLMLLCARCVWRLPPRLHHHKFIIIILMYNSISYIIMFNRQCSGVHMPHVTPMRKSRACGWMTAARRQQQQQQPHRNRSCILISLTFIIIIFAFTLLLFIVISLWNVHTVSHCRFVPRMIGVSHLRRRLNENVIWMRAASCEARVLMTSSWIDTKPDDNYCHHSGGGEQEREQLAEFIAPLRFPLNWLLRGKCSVVKSMVSTINAMLSLLCVAANFAVCWLLLGNEKRKSAADLQRSA